MGERKPRLLLLAVSLLLGRSPSSQCHAGEGNADRDCNADGIPDQLELKDLVPDAPEFFGEAAMGWVGKEDIDRDGDLDVVSLRVSEWGVWLWENDGEAGFTGRQILDRSFTTFTTGDLDADGRTDLIAGWKTVPGLVVFFDLGADEFDPGTLLRTNGAAASISTPDVDGDGMLDIVAAMHSFCGCITVLLNAGGRQFKFPLEFSVAANPSHAVARDFDGDHLVDVAVANFNDFVVTMVPNLGTDVDGNWLGFGPKNDVGLAAHHTWLEVADFDGDGADDLGLLHTTPEGISILRGDGTGRFSEPQTILTGIGMEAPAMTAVDLDGDGSPDLAIADSENAVLRLVLNAGSMHFRETSAVPHASRFVISGDFDGDGTPELVTGTQGIAVLRVNVENRDCDANGILDECQGLEPSFMTSRRYGMGDGPGDLELVDLDGDGLLDVATSNAFDDSVSILMGESRGRFRAASSVRTGGSPHSIASADFDGDGRIDLATANGGTSNVVLLGNKLQGTFVRLGAFPVGMNPQHSIASDWNNDGFADIATANVDGTLCVLIGKGDGTFLPRKLYPGGRALVRVAAGDLDADGDLDLCAAGFESANLSLYRGLGDGNYQPVAAVPVGGAPIGISIEDLDADGKLDIATANSFTGDVSILVGNGDLTMQEARFLSVAADVSHVVASDFDEDGALDLLVATADTSNYYSSLFFLSGDGDGGFSISLSALMGSQIADLVVMDLDGDGLRDVLTANFASDDVSVGLGRKDRLVDAPTTVPLPDPPERVRAADFNGDGALDLAAVDRRRNSLWTALGDGSGAFTVASPLPVERGSSWILADDLDGDGDLDLAVADYIERQVLVFSGDGSGGFTRTQRLSSGDSRSLVAADFDGDGLEDLVASNAIDGDLSIFAGQSGGGFGEARTLDLPGSPIILATEDYDRDGRADLAATLAAMGVGIFPGRGDGSFAEPRLYLSGMALGPMASDDLNLDGADDLVVYEGNLNRLTVLMGDGTGDFVEGMSHEFGASGRELRIADLNGDALPDLAAATIPAGLTVFEGDGEGRFGTALRFDAGNYAESLDIGDFDGDSRLDVVTADSTSQGPRGLKLIFNSTVPRIMDCNENGIPDACEIASGSETDMDGDLVPDSCETDCNGNGVPDLREIEEADCNRNSSLDACDVASGLSKDDNRNDVPDECESGKQVPGDCTQDGTVNISDGICMLGILFSGVPAEFPCGGLSSDSGNLSLLDWEPNGSLNISDAISLLEFAFLGGRAAPLAVPGAETSGCRSIIGCGSVSQCQ